MIVAVAGGKGGVGKSTIAVALGRALDAVVVDGDLATPDLPCGHGPTLSDVLADRAEPLDAVYERNSVQYLPCGRALAGTRSAKLTAFSRVVDRLERSYSRVVIDCPAGLARDVGVELESAQLAVLVTTPDRSALGDALRTHELALALDTPIAAVVLNRADPDVAGTVVDRVEHELGATTVLIDEQPSLREPINCGQPIQDIHPDCDAVAAIETVARSIDRYGRRRSDRPSGP